MDDLFYLHLHVKVNNFIKHINVNICIITLRAFYYFLLCCFLQMSAESTKSRLLALKYALRFTWFINSLWKITPNNYISQASEELLSYILVCPY